LAGFEVALYGRIYGDYRGRCGIEPISSPPGSKELEGEAKVLGISHQPFDEHSWGLLGTPGIIVLSGKRIGTQLSRAIVAERLGASRRYLGDK
jgi:hypothetical protein